MLQYVQCFSLPCFCKAALVFFTFSGDIVRDVSIFRPLYHCYTFSTSCQQAFFRVFHVARASGSDIRLEWCFAASCTGVAMAVYAGLEGVSGVGRRLVKLWRAGSRLDRRLG